MKLFNLILYYFYVRDKRILQLSLQYYGLSITFQWNVQKLLYVWQKTKHPFAFYLALRYNRNRKYMKGRFAYASDF